MPLRFFKRVRLLPGLSLNFSKRGVSTSVGVEGAHLTVGTHGTTVSVGVPGTGVSWRQKLRGLRNAGSGDAVS